MTFKKGQVINRGEHLSPETKAKILKDRKVGKKWKEIAADLNIPVKRAMTYAKRRWYKEGMKSEPAITQKEKDEGIETIPPGGLSGGVVEPGKKDEPGKSKDQDDVVGKVKKKAAANIDQAVSKQIKKSDKAPKSATKDVDLKNDTGGVDKGAKTGLSERKSINMWFLLAIIIAVATIGLIFIIMKPKGTEKADYNKPTNEEDKGGFEGRKISDL